MNLYFVLSETLEEIIWEDWFNRVGHSEPYCIADLVLANKPSQARWLAWKHDSSFTGDVRDRPKMATKVLAKDVCRFDAPHIVTSRPEYRWYWGMTGGVTR